jgi:hypothetical protein
MAGLLSDVLPFLYSQGDRAKRYMNGLLADPIGTMQQTAGGIVDAGNAQQGLLAQAFGNPQRPFQVTDPQALGQAADNTFQSVMGFAPAGIMAGVGAKTADMAALSKAQKLSDAGADPAVIWQQTGWGKGPDGKWRFEIDDSGSALKLGYAGSDNMRESLIDAYKKTGSLQRLPDVLGHKSATNAYPDLNSIHVVPGKGGGAGFFPEENRLSLGEIGAGNAREAMLHEMQHAVQDAEGFAKGGSPEQFNLRSLYPGMRMDPASYLHQESMKLSAQMNPVRDKLLEQYRAGALTASQVRDGMSAEAKRIGLKDVQDTLWAARNPEQAYSSLAGEAEARLVQNRMNMSPAERSAQFPWEPSYFREASGVPIESLLFRN